MAPKRQLFVTPPPGKRPRAAAAAAEDAPGSSPEPPSPPGKRLRAILLVVLFLKIRPKGRSRGTGTGTGTGTDTDTISALQFGRLMRDQLCHFLQPMFSKLESKLERKLERIDERIQDLTQKVDNLTQSSPNRHNHEPLTEEANQEGISADSEGLATNKGEGRSTSIRLRFLNGMKTPVYHDDEIKSESNMAIKIGIFDGDKMIKSGPLSKVKIEIVGMEGSFPYDSSESWTAKEFNQHIARGRDGKGDVLAGDGTTVQLLNGERDLGSIRFREGSCRARNRKFIAGARVCGGEAIGVRVQEAVMSPVVVQDRRNKSNEKSHPPKLNDSVHRLEEIAKDGIYCKRLEDEKISTVKDFLKALNKDPVNLARILKINVEHKPWGKMIQHARKCCLEGKHKLKSYDCADRKVKLFFNCVHYLVGAAFFGGGYTPSDKFNPTQQVLVDELKKSAYAELDVLPEDHIMVDNSPTQINMNTYAGAGSGSFYMSSETQPKFSIRPAAVQVGAMAAVEGLRLARIEPSCANANNDPCSSCSIPDHPSCSINYRQVGCIPAVEGLSHGQVESNFANVNDDPGPSFSIPDQPRTHNYQANQGTRFTAQEQLSSAFHNGLCEDPLGGRSFSFGTTDASNMSQFVSHEGVEMAFLQHQADTNNYGLDDVEIQSLLVCGPSNGTIDASTSAHINMTLTPQQLTIPGALVSAQGSMQRQKQALLPPSNGATEASASAQGSLPPKQWFQCQGDMPWNGSI